MAIDGNNTAVESIGSRIRRIRKENKLTVKELSEMSGVPGKTIYRIETGEVSDPKVSSLIPLVKTMNCSADEILFNKEDYISSGKLRQLFANLEQLDDHHLDTIAEGIRLSILGCSFEEMMSEEMNKKYGGKEEKSLTHETKYR